VSRVLRRLVVLVGLLLPLCVLLAPAASAHPLGRFTVNHYNGLTLHPNRLGVHAVVDSAEIPTFQTRSEVDTDGDRAISDPEARAYATARCDRLSRAVSATVDGETLRFTVRSAAVSYPPGEAGLPTTRLTCELTASADLDEPAIVTFTDSFQPDRIGWREITATGEGVRLQSSPVPKKSVSDQLRNYPADLLQDPLKQLSVQLEVEPDGSAIGADQRDLTTGRDGTGSLLERLSDRFSRFVGTVELTPIVGVLALLLSLVLGASHAALPGHGKTVIAAYLAGRSGTARDALIVGGTVTATHTAGVLVLALLLSAFATLAGESVLGWLGVTSGLLVIVIGALLLRSALQARQAGGAGSTDDSSLALVRAGDRDNGHMYGHGHMHGHGHGHDHGHRNGMPVGADPLSRPMLFGMGVAAGLVPSPTALLVLLATIGFGRTWFGVLLVFGYGVGMAGTLTAVGLLLVNFRGRIEHKLSQVNAARTMRRIIAAAPALTAVLVLAVGIGIATRGILQVIQ
jgi:ABC-type nickel/cobalt efflux system permease component RcnA